MKMKKLIFSLSLVLAFFAGTSVYASSNEQEAYGTISAIDVLKKEMTITGDDGKAYSFSVNPATDIEIKRKYLPDTDGDLDDLKTGDWVKVEYKTTASGMVVAEDIEVHREK